jgi:hypothetical protein
MYGVENAIAWLTNPLRTSEVLKTDDTAAGYYSAWGDRLLADDLRLDEFETADRR